MERTKHLANKAFLRYISTVVHKYRITKKDHLWK